MGMRIKYLLSVIVLISVIKTQAQQGFSIAGGDANAVTGSASFTFGQIDYAAANNNNMSFGIQQSFDSSKPLPVNILEFTAHKKDSIVLLQWTTTNQVNCKNFIVERSQNGKEFNVVVNTIDASNTNQTKHIYQTTDNKPVKGFNYYRLKIVDNNGSVTYSQIVLIKFDTKEPNVVLYPNPTSNVVNINIGFIPTLNDNVICEIFNVEGNKIVNQKIVSMVSQIDMTKQTIGMYLLKITNNTQNIITLQLIKN